MKTPLRTVEDLICRDMGKQKDIDYREVFFFPDIPTQPYPKYLINANGKLTNFKSVIYPSLNSAKRYTRKKQLKFRSQQTKIFDALINVGYFEPLVVYKEFPIPIQNVYRLEGQKRLYYMIDFFFPEINLAVELDSEYHDEGKQTRDPDPIRDEYLMKAHGIEVFRIRDLHKEVVQRTKFRKLAEKLRESFPNPNRPPLIFTNDLYKYLNSKGL